VTRPDEARPETRGPSRATVVRLVAGREISTRLRDRTFLISSAVIIVLVLGAMLFQVVLASRTTSEKIGVAGAGDPYRAALVAQGKAIDVDVTVVRFADAAAAGRAVQADDVDGALVRRADGTPQLLVHRTADPPLQAVVQGAVAQVSLGQQLTQAGADLSPPAQVPVRSLDPNADRNGQRTAVAIVAVGLLYALLILFGQFVAQGVVEEKASRVVELLLATMRPWQLLAGKILGLGLLGLGQIVVISAVGVTGAMSFGVVDLPGQLIGTVVTVIAWFVVGYALYAALFAATASLVSRQEDLASVIMPTTFLLLAGFFISLVATGNPSGTLATVTSFIPGLSPLVMPVRQAAGVVAWWEVALAAVLMLVAIAAVVRLGGRIYAGALLRTSGKTKLREALRAERV
jgi:ABC-2 type transport system permease protein